MLRRSPGFSALAILCLTVGIGAPAAVFSWIEGILLRPYPLVVDQERLFAVTGTNIVAGRTQGFDIRPGSAVENLAQYSLTSANTFFTGLAKTSGTTAPPLPMDAGQLQFSAAQQLEFLGNLEL